MSRIASARTIGAMRVQHIPFVMMSLALVLAACSGNEREADTAPPIEPMVKLGAEMPTPRDGSDVVGRNVASLLPTEWVGTPVSFGTPEAPRATLVRFWTDTCRFCERSLPEIEALRERYRTRGFETVGVYHPKPARDVDKDTVRTAAERLGYTGLLALDPHWTSLRAIWPERSRNATSSSFLLDRSGVVRYVHPGPEFVGDDLAQLEQAINALLASAPAAEAFGRAVELSRSSHDEAALAALRLALETDPQACQRALLEPAFDSGLRDLPEFRTAVHDAAVRHGVSSLTLVRDDEPGEWIEVEGRLVDSAGTPVPGGVVRLYATAADGRYHPEIEGERLARIFGTLVADVDGRFTFRTVRPGSYPGTRDARHVHVAARAGDLRLAKPQYAVFDDDPLLEEPQNEEQRGEAVRIEMQVVDGQARGTLVLPMH